MSDAELLLHITQLKAHIKNRDSTRQGGKDMRDQQRVVVIAKQRPFDEEKWKQLLIAFAYVLHEQRRAQEQTLPDDTPNGEVA